MDVTTSETSSSLLFLGFIFYQCFKTFLTRRTAFCFYVLKEKFLLRRKKILWRRRLKQGNFLAPFPKHMSFWGKTEPAQMRWFSSLSLADSFLVVRGTPSLKTV